MAIKLSRYQQHDDPILFTLKNLMRINAYGATIQIMNLTRINAYGATIQTIHGAV